MVSDWISGVGIGFSERGALDDLCMYKNASSELVVARRRGGADDRAEDMCVAAADRVQRPLVEDHGDDPIHRAGAL